MKRQPKKLELKSPVVEKPRIRKVDGLSIKTHVKAGGGYRNANHPAA